MTEKQQKEAAIREYLTDYLIDLGMPENEAFIRALEYVQRRLDKHGEL